MWHRYIVWLNSVLNMSTQKKPQIVDAIKCNHREYITQYVIVGTGPSRPRFSEWLDYSGALALAVERGARSVDPLLAKSPSGYVFRNFRMRQALKRAAAEGTPESWHCAAFDKSIRGQCLKRVQKYCLIIYIGHIRCSLRYIK